MDVGFVPSARARAASPLHRTLEPDEWVDGAVPLLGNPREVVKDICSRHLPAPTTAVVAVSDQTGRTVASASFTPSVAGGDGWERRNAILSHLRRVLPHDLRLRAPVRTAVLLVCRSGVPGWTVEDGAWMWGLRDACTLHGLRCGAYITLTTHGWRVLGDGRSGRTPHSGSWAGEETISAPKSGPGGPVESVRRHVAR
jgi:hypothetical protein